MTDHPFAAVSPLTCRACRNSPATHLVVADLAARKVPRLEQLNCQACADFSVRHAALAGDHLYLYRLVPEEVRKCRHCGAPIRRCTHIGTGTPDYPLCKGWRHAGYDSQPVIGHCCGGRSINPAAEPREDGNDG